LGETHLAGQVGRRAAVSLQADSLFRVAGTHFSPATHIRSVPPGARTRREERDSDEARLVYRAGGAEWIPSANDWCWGDRSHSPVAGCVTADTGRLYRSLRRWLKVQVSMKPGRALLICRDVSEGTPCPCKGPGGLPTCPRSL